MGYVACPKPLDTILGIVVGVTFYLAIDIVVGSEITPGIVGLLVYFQWTGFHHQVALRRACRRATSSP